MSKQTAVEWLVGKIINKQNGTFDGFPVLSLDEIFQQAKEMEKEQIIDAASDHCYPTRELARIDAEQYYNETYKKDK
jgi:hypothetical protein